MIALYCSFTVGIAFLLLGGVVWRDARLLLTAGGLQLLRSIGATVAYYFYVRGEITKNADRTVPMADAPKRGSLRRIGEGIMGALEAAILFGGLVMLIASKDSSIWLAPGWMIWGGAIGSWFACGVIAREVGGVPLSMGRGGWAIRRDRRGRYL